MLISEGQLSNILIQGKGAFHQEKNELLPAGIAANGQVKVDDSGACHRGKNGYSTIIGNESCTYIVSTESKSRINFLQILHGTEPRYADWEKFLLEINIKAEGDIKLATEAALFANLIDQGIPRNLGLHGDDAGQFNVFVRSLCWVHEERHYRKLIPFDEIARQAIEQVRGEIWDLYRWLQKYKLAPSESLKSF